jgi:hypothetical protein
MGRALRADKTVRRRATILLALAAAGALTATGIALAAASSSGTFTFTPSNPHNQVTSGRLVFGTNTSYTGLTSTTRIQLGFDDDFYFNPDSFPKCNPADISGSMTMQQALQQCGPGAGAANNAWLFPPTATFGNGKALFSLGPEGPTACVLVFNGSGATSEVLLFIRTALESPDPIDCASPTTNTDGDSSFLVRGDLKANPAAMGSDYTDPDNCSAPGFRRGCQIDFANVSNGPLRLVNQNVRIMRANYIRARCVDPPAGSRRWNVRMTFTYANPAGTQTVNKSQACT